MACRYKIFTCKKHPNKVLNHFSLPTYLYLPSQIYLNECRAKQTSPTGCVMYLYVQNNHLTNILIFFARLLTKHPRSVARVPYN